MTLNLKVNTPFTSRLLSLMKLEKFQNFAFNPKIFDLYKDTFFLISVVSDELHIHIWYKWLIMSISEFVQHF